MDRKKFVQELIQIEKEERKQVKTIETIEDVIDTLENARCPQTIGVLARGKYRCAVGVLLERMGATYEDLIFDVNTGRLKMRLNKILREYNTDLGDIFMANDRKWMTFRAIATHMKDKVWSARADELLRDLHEARYTAIKKQEVRQARSIQTSR